MGIEGQFAHENVITTTLDFFLNWARKSSLWPLGFGIKCCAIEMMTASSSRYDFDRLGVFFRGSPRQSDLMIVAGPVCRKMVPVIKRLYDQMPNPKYVIAMGSCAISAGAFYESYNVVRGVNKILPVDVYVPGCPPRPEALMHGVLKLQERIERKTIVRAT